MLCIMEARLTVYEAGWHGARRGANLAREVAWQPRRRREADLLIFFFFDVLHS